MTGRDRIGMMGVALLALLGGFWFLVLSPKRAEIATVSTRIAAAQKRLDAAHGSVAQAQRAKRDYDTDYAAVARLGQAVPIDDNVPSLVYQLQSVSHNARVEFRSLKLTSTGTATPAPATAAPAAAATGDKPSSATALGTPSATSAPATQLAAAALPPGAAVGPAGFPTMPFTFVFDGSFFDMEHMLRNVDRFITVDGRSVNVRGRLLSVDGFGLQPGPTGFPAVTATISATAYLLPADQGLTAGASPAAPGAPAAAATASSARAPAPPTAAAAATGVTP